MTFQGRGVVLSMASSPHFMSFVIDADISHGPLADSHTADSWRCLFIPQKDISDG